MKLKTIYLMLCALGIILPYWQFIPWVAANGLHIPLLVHELFANRVSAFFGVDVLISSLTGLAGIRASGGYAAGHPQTLVAGAGTDHARGLTCTTFVLVHAGNPAGERKSRTIRITGWLHLPE